MNDGIDAIINNLLTENKQKTKCPGTDGVHVEFHQILKKLKYYCLSKYSMKQKKEYYEIHFTRIILP